jgi:hypothetical protein
MTTTRRLAAILAADVAGYSRLIGAESQRLHPVCAGESYSPLGANRNRKFVDSLLEEDGFELPVRSLGKPGYRPFCAAQAPRAARTQAPGRGDACDLLLLSCRPRC